MTAEKRKQSVPAEPTFGQAQTWWSKMQRPVTFTGVAGHPHQATVLWNTGLLFCSNPREWEGGRPRLGSAWGLAPSLAQGMDGYELDALQIEFSFGEAFHIPDRLDNTGGEGAQKLLEGRMPVVISRLKHDEIEWTCTVFSRAVPSSAAPKDSAIEDRQLLTEVQWVARNPTRRARRTLLSCHLTAPHILLGYKVKMEEKAGPYLRALSWEAPVLRDSRRAVRLAAAAEQGGEVTFAPRLSGDGAGSAAELGLAQDVLQFRARVPAGGSVGFRMIVPFTAVKGDDDVVLGALRTRFERALARTQRDWRRVFRAARIDTPEQIVNDCFDAYLYHAMIATARRPVTGHCILKCSPNNYEAVWAAHSAIAAHSMDLQGQHELSRPVVETLLACQGPLPDHILKLFGDTQVGESEGFSAHPGFLGNIEGHMAVLWANYHGWIMWAIAEHARLTNEWAWLGRHAGRLALACEWIEEQRARTRVLDKRGEKALSYGLLPASNAFDWGFGHMFWSDASTYRGLKAIAECLRRIRHPRAAQFLVQAQDYRTDIATAVARSRDASAPVPLEDGSIIPFVPMSVEMRDFFAPDWTYVSCGPLHLAWAGVVSADHELMQQVLAFLEAGRPLGEWDASRGEYQGWDWAAQVPADEDFLEATRPESGRCSLWRHRMTYEPGWIPQAFTFMALDDIPAMLEHLYSLISNGGQHVDLRTPVEQRDGVAWTQPGDANLLWLIRDMLVREEGDDLVLAGSCPRAWLSEGKTVGVTDLPTHFGLVSYRLRASAMKITGSFGFRFHTVPKSIRIRLRRLEGRVPHRVRVDGKPAAANGEWIAPPPNANKLEAWYR